MRFVAFVLTAILGTGALADDRELTFRSPFDAICTTPQIFAETLYNYGEIPIMRGQSLRSVNDTMVSMITVLFMNPKTGSWTLAEQMAGDTICVIAMGQDWEVYQEQNSTPDTLSL